MYLLMVVFLKKKNRYVAVILNVLILTNVKCDEKMFLSYINLP